MGFKKLITMIGIGAMLMGCSTQAVENKEEQFDFKKEQAYEEVRKTDEYNDSVKELLKQQGMSDEDIEKVETSENGATIIGGAKPVVSYRTLHDAETAFGNYLGLHNTIQLDEEYNLVSMMIINKTILFGTYENLNADRTFTVKLSIEDNLEKIKENAYPEYEESSKLEINGIEATLWHDDNGAHLLEFECSNEKKYVLFSLNGIKQIYFESIAEELIDNLMIMEDWEE